eukprot:12846673-Prorocentrum_lima.AAC.1
MEEHALESGHHHAQEARGSEVVRRTDRFSEDVREILLLLTGKDNRRWWSRSGTRVAAEALGNS